MIIPYTELVNIILDVFGYKIEKYVNIGASIIDYKRKCPEQINMYKICNKFTFFEFRENYNIQCSRLTCVKETHSRKKKNEIIFFYR